MRNQLRSKRWIICSVAASIGLSCGAAQPAERHRSLTMHGERYPNACDSAEKSELRNALLKSNVEHAEQAWYAVSTILCCPSNSHSRAYITSLLPESVRPTSDATGVELTVSTVRPTAELVEAIMAKGRAWNAALSTENRTIRLNYFKNEACVDGITLRVNARGWDIDELGQACD